MNILLIVIEIISRIELVIPLARYLPTSPNSYWFLPMWIQNCVNLFLIIFWLGWPGSDTVKHPLSAGLNEFICWSRLNIVFLLEQARLYFVCCSMLNIVCVIYWSRLNIVFLLEQDQLSYLLEHAQHSLFVGTCST